MLFIEFGKKCIVEVEQIRTVRESKPADAAAIFNKEGEVLLQKRCDTENWGDISGHVKFDETLQQAVLREIKEKVAVSAEIVRLIGIYSNPQSQLYFYEG